MQETIGKFEWKVMYLENIKKSKQVFQTFRWYENEGKFCKWQVWKCKVKQKKKGIQRQNRSKIGFEKKVIKQWLNNKKSNLNGKHNLWLPFWCLVHNVLVHKGSSLLTIKIFINWSITNYPSVNIQLYIENYLND